MAMVRKTKSDYAERMSFMKVKVLCKCTLCIWCEQTGGPGCVNYYTCASDEITISSDRHNVPMCENFEPKEE